MRFSLATLLLVVLWMGAAMAAWFWRQPWALSNIETEKSPYKVPVKIDFPSYALHSPDGSRVFTVDYPNYFAGEIHNSSGKNTLLYQFPRDFGRGYGFLDDDTVLFDNLTRAEYEASRNILAEDNHKYVLYRRRFPEWWWGHFYRLEVWLFAALSGILIWRSVVARKRSGRDARAP